MELGDDAIPEFVGLEPLRIFLRDFSASISSRRNEIAFIRRAFSSRD